LRRNILTFYKREKLWTNIYMIVTHTFVIVTSSSPTNSYTGSSCFRQKAKE